MEFQEPCFPDRIAGSEHPVNRKTPSNCGYPTKKHEVSKDPAPNQKKLKKIRGISKKK
jgi:hypothetical protein